MRTITGTTLIIFSLTGLLGLWCLTPARAFPVAPPPESLAGLTPGCNTVADAERLFGCYNTRLPGEYSGYAGGPRAADSYRWTNDGMEGQLPGLIVETSLCSPRINCVVVDQYPGIATSRGLMTLVPEIRALQYYGCPDFVFSIMSPDYDQEYHELFYISRGLIVITGDVESLANLTIIRLILTYPTYLRSAVASRISDARIGLYVEDITDSYATWAHIAYPNG